MKKTLQQSSLQAESVGKENKPGTAQVGAIAKAQNSKRTSKCQKMLYPNFENVISEL